jgi:hypothetical protein
MLFKLADNRFPSGPEHDALGQINWFTETAIKIRVVMFFGTLTGCSLLAKALNRVVKFPAATVSL